jgi:uncharacterized protein YukE
LATLETNLGTISLAGQVLARQSGHCRSAADYLSTRGSIAGSTGLILAGLVPVSDAITAAGTSVLRTAGAMCDATAHATQRTADAYRQVDGDAGTRFNRLAGDLVTGWNDGPTRPPAGLSTLGPAREGAPHGWGDTDSWFWEKATSARQSLQDTVRHASGLVGHVGDWGQAAGPVVEAVDARSFLTEPTAGESWAQDMRWSAGLILGGVDWVFEQLCGYSILEETIYKPFAGDSREVTKAANAWTNSGAVLSAVGLNHARLVPTTTDEWRGDAGDAFRGAMGLVAEGFHQISTAYEAVAAALDVVSTGMKGICAAIGAGLRTLAQLLLDIAAQASVPVAGWAALAATAYWKVEKVVTVVRLVYTLIETALSLVASFADARVAVVDGVARFEDLAEGVFRRAGQGMP